MVTDEGEKQKQLLATVTVTVAALVVGGWRTRSEATVATINAKPCEKVFIGSVVGYSHRRHVLELQTIRGDMQFRKSDEVVTYRTFLAGQECGQADFLPGDHVERLTSGGWMV